MSSAIGILQGRLSPSPDGRFQFFPHDWETEFFIAGTLGFSTIEWLVDWPDWASNPILNLRSEALIRRVIGDSGVPINSVCADYFMKYRLIGTKAKESEKVVLKIIDAAARLTRQKLVLIPLLEKNAYPTEPERAEVVSHLMPAVREAERIGVRIGFETEMSVKEIREWLGRFESPAVGAYYDVGNCTSYGFNCPSDLRTLGKMIYGVHIKDRKKDSSQSVTLGSGDVDIQGCLAALKEIRFGGVPIMQAWRGDDYKRDAVEQLDFLKRVSFRDTGTG